MVYSVLLTCVHGLLEAVSGRDAAGEELDAEAEPPRRAAPAGVLEAAHQVLPLVRHRGGSARVVTAGISSLFTFSHFHRNNSEIC